MIYLSRLRLNLRSSRVAAELRDLHSLHRTLVRAVAEPDQSPADARLLFRREVDGDTAATEVVLVQTLVAPDWSRLDASERYFVESPETKAFEPKLVGGKAYAFRLRANPVVKREGKRLGLVGDDAQRAWLDRKLEDGGFRLLDASALDEGFVRGRRTAQDDEPRALLTWRSVRFDGTVRVIDDARALRTLHSGVGPAKAFGFGLLSLARA